MLSLIDQLKRVKATASGKERWRFSVSADVLGDTVWVPGWVYLPASREGYRVNPPKSGRFRLVTGVTQKLCARLEKLVEAKLERTADEPAPALEGAEPGTFEEANEAEDFWLGEGD